MKRRLVGAACVLMLLASGAHAHGSRHANPGDQAAPPAFEPAAVEQKAFGRAADPEKTNRTVHIVMEDNMRFTPAEISVNEGDIIKFVVSNRGAAMHEMVLGTGQELLEHAAMMRKFPEMEHDEPYMAHVAPGKEEVLAWHFNQAGEFDYACLIPGHSEAGMVGKIKVKAAAKPAVR